MSNDQYLSLKKKLEHFQYCSPLGVESVSLVEKLLSDLLKTTQGFQDMKIEKERLKEQLEAEKMTPLPLRNENAKLVKENNELHREIIKLKEDLDAKDLRLEQSIKKLENEKEEMKFLLKQKDLNLKNIENESESLRRKMNEVLAKCYEKNDAFGLPNAEKILKTQNSKNLIGRKQEFELTKALDVDLESKFNELSNNNFNLVDKEQWANDLKQADERAEKYRREIQKLDSENNAQQIKIQFLEKQIQTRDTEIRRMQNSAMIGTNNIEELKMRYQTDNLKNTVEKLNAQIDFLNTENQKKSVHAHRCKEEEVKKLDNQVEKLKREKEGLSKKLENLMKNSGENLPSNNLKSPQITVNKHEIQNLNDLVSTLSNELALLKTQNTKLKEDSAENNSNFNSEKLLLSKSLLNLQQENTKQANTNSELRSLLDALSKQNEELVTELNLLKGREMITNKNVEFQSENSTKISKEYYSLAQEGKELRKKICELEDRIILLLKENKEVKLDNENLKDIENSLKSKSKNLEENLEKMKNLSENLHRESEKKDNSLKILNTKHSLLEEELTSMNKMIENKNERILEIENKNQNLLKQLEDANDSYVTIQAENRNLSGEIQNLLISNKRSEDKIKNYEREFSESKFVKEKLSEYQEKEKLMKNEIKALERENKIITNEIKNLNERLNNSNKEIETVNEMLKKSENEKNSLKKENENYSVKVTELESEIQDFSEKQENFASQGTDLSNKLISLKKDNDNLRAEKSNLEFEIKKKNLEISRNFDSHEKLIKENKTIKSESEILRSEIEKLEDKLFNHKLTENSTFEFNILELKEVLNKEKSENEKLNFDLQNCIEKYNKIITDKSNLEKTIDKLTKLLNEADSTRQELYDKLQDQMGKNKSIENNVQILLEKEDKWQTEISKYLEENKRLKHALNSIDQNYDNLISELDTKTEDLSRLNLVVNNLKSQNDELTQKLSITLNKSNIDTKRVVERDYELCETKQSLAAYREEVEDLKVKLGERINQANDLNYDLNIIQNENQALIEDINKASKEIERLSIIKSQLEKNLEILTNRTRASELDSNEIYSNYKDLCQENERLKQNLQIFIDENKEAAVYIRELEGMIDNFKSNVSGTVNERDNLSKKMEFLEKYNSSLSEENTKLKREIESLHNKSINNSGNYILEREININYENQISNLTKTIAKLESEKRSMIEDINKMNTHIEYLNHNSNITDKNMKNYESIIAEERRKIFNANVINEKLKEEISSLREENKRIVSMINQHKDIKELKNRILTSKMDSNVLTNPPEEDNGILKNLINDLNTQIEDLKKDLRHVRDENNRLLSERSMNLISVERAQNSDRKSEDSIHSLR